MDFIVPLLFIHIILYLAWKMTAQDEKNSRPDGRKIPTYATGGLGNLIGFSLMTTGVSLASLDLFSNWFLLIVLVSLLATLLLHWYWKRTVRGTTVSLYLPNGTTTLAGWLHLLYVAFISFMILTFISNIAIVDVMSLMAFSGGCLLYIAAITIDKYRGVI